MRQVYGTPNLSFFPVQTPEQMINDLCIVTAGGNKGIYSWKDSPEAQRNLHENVLPTSFRNSMLWTSQLLHGNGV